MDTQQIYIHSLTENMLNKCTQTLVAQYDEIKNKLIEDLTNSIKIDIYDKIYGEKIKLEYKKYNIQECIASEIKQYGVPTPLTIKTLLPMKTQFFSIIQKKYNLKQNENIIYYYFINKQTVRYDTDDAYLRSCVDGCIITDLSTMITGNVVIQGYFKNFHYDNNNFMKQCNMNENNININIHGTPLHPLFIKMLQDSGICPSNVDISNYFSNILKHNKEFYMMFLTEADLHKKMDTLINDNNMLQIKINELGKQVSDLQIKLKNAIPLENQCCICFSFTDKKKLIVPCGHTQYCDKCIFIIIDCGICRSKIDKIINIF